MVFSKAGMYLSIIVFIWLMLDIIIRVCVCVCVCVCVGACVRACVRVGMFPKCNAAPRFSSKKVVVIEIIN